MSSLLRRYINSESPRMTVPQWESYFRRTIAVMMAQGGMIVSMLVVFSCNFFVVSVDSDWLPVKIGGFQVTTYDISVGLFRYTISRDSLDFVESAECRVYDEEFVESDYNEFFDGSHAAAQFFSLFAPIFALFGCVFLCSEACCKFKMGYSFTVVSWFLAFLFQSLCFVIFREKDFCRGSEDITSCRIAAGAWFCIFASFLYFGAIVVLLCAFPRSSCTTTKTSTSFSDTDTFGGQSPIAGDIAAKQQEKDDDDLEAAGGSPFSDKTQPTTTMEESFDDDDALTTEPNDLHRNDNTYASRNLESVWNDDDAGNTKSAEVSTNDDEGETAGNDESIRLMMSDGSFDAGEPTGESDVDPILSAPNQVDESISVQLDDECVSMDTQATEDPAAESVETSKELKEAPSHDSTWNSSEDPDRSSVSELDEPLASVEISDKTTVGIDHEHNVATLAEKTTTNNALENEVLVKDDVANLETALDSRGMNENAPPEGGEKVDSNEHEQLGEQADTPQDSSSTSAEAESEREEGENVAKTNSLAKSNYDSQAVHESSSSGNLFRQGNVTNTKEVGHVTDALMDIVKETDASEIVSEDDCTSGVAPNRSENPESGSGLDSLEEQPAPHQAVRRDETCPQGGDTQEQPCDTGGHDGIADKNESPEAEEFKEGTSAKPALLEPATVDSPSAHPEDDATAQKAGSRLDDTRSDEAEVALISSPHQDSPRRSEQTPSEVLQTPRPKAEQNIEGSEQDGVDDKLSIPWLDSKKEDPGSDPVLVFASASPGIVEDKFFDCASTTSSGNVPPDVFQPEL